MICLQTLQDTVQCVSKRVETALTNKYYVYFMISENERWNFSFSGSTISNDFKYNVILGNPKDYYNKIHRHTYFLNFNNKENNYDNEKFNTDYFSYIYKINN